MRIYAFKQLFFDKQENKFDITNLLDTSRCITAKTVLSIPTIKHLYVPTSVNSTSVICRDHMFPLSACKEQKKIRKMTNKLYYFTHLFVFNCFEFLRETFLISFFPSSSTTTNYFIENQNYIHVYLQ